MKFKNIILLTLAAVATGCASTSTVATDNSAPVTVSDQWAYTDALGRAARDYNTAGEKRDGKYVGMFYWTWHNHMNDTSRRVVKIPDVLASHPEAMNDYDSPHWGGVHKPDIFFWSEPLFGFYQPTDKWVLRKHA